MNNRAVRSVIYGEVGFFVFLIIQIILRPAGLTANSGVSYYSAIKATIIPYTIGFLVAAYYLLQSASLLKNTNYLKIISRALRLCACLLLAMVVAPDITHSVVSAIHTLIGASLFITELALAIWLAVYICPNWFNRALATIQLGAGIICFFSIIEMLTWQIEGQIVFQLVFGILVARSIWQLEKTISQDS